MIEIAQGIVDIMAMVASLGILAVVLYATGVVCWALWVMAMDVAREKIEDWWRA